MSKAKRVHELIERLQNNYGVSYDDAVALRRIQMTLRRWGELECGIDSGGIERDEKTDKPYWTYDRGPGPRGRYAIPDREKGALKRLAAILERYPALVAYHQTDARGCALYVLKRSDVRKGEKLDEIYTRGFAVCE